MPVITAPVHFLVFPEEPVVTLEEHPVAKSTHPPFERTPPQASPFDEAAWWSAGGTQINHLTFHPKIVDNRTSYDANVADYTAKVTFK